MYLKAGLYSFGVMLALGLAGCSLSASGPSIAVSTSEEDPTPEADSPGTPDVPSPITPEPRATEPDAEPSPEVAEPQFSGPLRLGEGGFRGLRTSPAPQGTLRVIEGRFGGRLSCNDTKTLCVMGSLGNVQDNRP